MSHLDYDPTVMLLQKENAEYLEEIFRLTKELEELKSEKAKAAEANITPVKKTQE